MEKVKIKVCDEEIEVNKSYKTLIRHKCLDCSTGQVEEVRRCPVVSCPLYSVRPFRTTEEKAARVKDPIKQERARKIAEAKKAKALEEGKNA